MYPRQMIKTTTPIPISQSVTGLTDCMQLCTMTRQKTEKVVRLYPYAVSQSTIAVIVTTVKHLKVILLRQSRLQNSKETVRDPAIMRRSLSIRCSGVDIFCQNDYQSNHLSDHFIFQQTTTGHLIHFALLIIVNFGGRRWIAIR